MSFSNLINKFVNRGLNCISYATPFISKSSLGAIGLPNLESACQRLAPVFHQAVRYVGKQNPMKYKRGLKSHCYRRWIDKPEKYTTDLISFRRLGGRDPVTGRVVVSTIGGGIKHKYRWVLFTRHVPKDSEPLVERVHSIHDDPLRTAKIALVASGDEKRWILATTNMKEGDLIKTSSKIPRIPVRPNEGDAWPLGALPIGTVVHNVEPYPGTKGYFARAAGTCCQILRKVGGRVIIQIPSKREVSLSEECMAVVGRVSNIEHNKIPIGSAQANRWLGNRPRSGLWHRKDGYCGRKIRPLPPMKEYAKPKKPSSPVYQLTM